MEGTIFGGDGVRLLVLVGPGDRVPTGTVNVAGLNLKSVMLDRVPPCGAADADTVGELLATGAGTGAYPPCRAPPFRVWC